MERVCFLLRVKEDRVQDYIKAHDVWPELDTATKEVGINNFSRFIKEDGLVVGYFEAENPQESLRKLSQMDINRRWDEHMAEFFDGGSGNMEEGGVEWLKQYYYLA